MKKCSFFILTLAVLAGSTAAMDGKTIGHLVAIPLIEGAGIYTSVRMIGTGDGNATAAAVTNLGLAGLNAGIGAYTLFGKPANYETLRTIHRIAGFATSAASIWMTASAIMNKDVRPADRAVSTGYSVLTVVPLFMFKF